MVHIFKYKCVFSLLLCLIGMRFNARGQQAQPVNGYIIDMQTNQHLEGVHIIINKNKGTVTDSGGYFSIVINPHDTLKISHIGYGITTYFGYDFLNQTSPLYLYLEPESYALQEVRIVPYKTYEEFKEYFKKTKVDMTDLNAAMDKSNIVKLHIKKGYIPDYDSYSLYREQCTYPMLRQEGVTIWRMRKK